MIKLLITTGIFPPEIGGPATFLEHLASDLSGHGFDVSVLTYGAPAKKARDFRLYSVSRSWPSSLKQILYGLKTFWLARRADIIYTTDLYSPGYYSMLVAGFWRKKFAVRFAGDSAWETAQNMGLCADDVVTFQSKDYSPLIGKRKAQRAKILQSADAVVAVSDFMKGLAIKIGVPADKIQVIYNAVDFFGNVPVWQAPAVPTLVYSGRLTPWKGVEVLIGVVAKLKQKYPEIKFEILGDGPEEGRLKTLVKSFRPAGDHPEGEKLEENVNFHGRVSEEETHKVFSRSTIFVLNTNYEGLSHAILNAMSVGIPVITTPVGGNPELIKDGENGLLVAYNDQAAWTGAIEKLLADEPLQEKFSVNGQQFVEKFKWSGLIGKTVGLLKGLE